MVFLALALVALVTIAPRVGSWNDASRIATIQSLVDSGSLSIEHSSITTMDKVFIGGHFYSDKPVLPQAMGAVVYAPLRAMGLKLAWDWNLSYYLITLLTVKLFWWLSLVAFEKSLGFTGLGQARRLLLTVALGLGTLALSWSATFNSHSLAASFMGIGFSFLLRAKHADGGVWGLFVSGLWFGLAGSSDVATLAFPAAFGCYLLFDARLRKGFLAYAAAVLLAVLPTVAVNYGISGSVVPVQLVQEYFQFPGSPWNDSKLTGAKINRGLALIDNGLAMLLGGRGFLLYNPFSLLALPLMLLELVRRRRFAAEAAVVLVVSVIIVGYYVLWSHNFGGDSFSIRWFVPLLPLWMFFLYPLLERPGRREWATFFLILLVSVPIAWIGTWNPWSSGRINQVPLLSNLITMPDRAHTLWTAIVTAFSAP